jgi:formate hydrogenlyase transcriptional activator
MQVEVEQTGSEAKQLRACINDLMGVVALPAIWSGSDPSEVVRTLLDALLDMLRLDFVYLRLKNSIGEPPFDAVRGPLLHALTGVSQHIEELLKNWWGDHVQEWPRVVRTAFQDKDLSIIPLPLGLNSEIGVLVAGSQRKDFPLQTERLLLTVAANQAAVGLHGARLLSEQKGVADELDRKRKRLERELELERDRLKIVLELNNSLVSNLELKPLFSALASGLRKVMECEFAGIFLPEGDNQLRLQLSDFPDTKGYFKEGMLVPMRGSAAGVVFRTGTHLLLRNSNDKWTNPEIHTGPDADSFLKLVELEGFQSGCFVPLKRAGATIGVLALTKKREDPIAEQDLGFLDLVSAQVSIAVANALSFKALADTSAQLKREKLYLEEELRTEHGFEEIIGNSYALRRVLQQVETVAPTDSIVLIQGETGTGKELIARAIHEHSARKASTFVKLNCAAIPLGLLESELFGHEKGAFTGAIAQKVGRFELANRGTIFLDEVGDIPLELQPKLLRVLQEQEFERLGGTRSIRVNVRLISATNRDLARMMADRQFRTDLYYRLNVFPIQLPSLRERRDDIPLLVRHFTQRYARKMGKHITSIPAEALDQLSEWHWPGNIRELENFVERAVIITRGTELMVPVTELDNSLSASSKNSYEDEERDRILQALRASKGRLAGAGGAAERLSLKRTTLIARMKKLGIDAKRLRQF